MLLSKESLSIILGALPTFRVQITNLKIADNHKSKAVYCLEDVQQRVLYDWYNGTTSADTIQAWDRTKETLEDALPNEDTPEISNLFYTLECLEAGFVGLSVELNLEKEGRE